MDLPRDLMLARFLARDASFDGRFVTGVVTTGIYCLPSCPARRPRPENVRFFAGESEARAAGLRPCKRCRPERWYRRGDPELALARAIAARVFAAPGELRDVAALARAAGIGATKLAALCRRHFHATPAALLLGARVEHAKRELHASARRVLDVALDAGFESSSAFHAGFRRLTRLTPSAWRALVRERDFELSLPACFRADDALADLFAFPQGSARRTGRARVVRAVVLASEPAALLLELGDHSARVRVECAAPLDAARLAQAHAIALRLLGLTDEPAALVRRARELVALRPGLSLPRAPEPFEGLVAVLATLAGDGTGAVHGRLAERIGARVAHGVFASPTPAELAPLERRELVALGCAPELAERLLALARAVHSGALELVTPALRSAPALERALVDGLRIAPWVAAWALARAFGFADAAPALDPRVRAGLGRLGARLDDFAPQRSLAAHHLRHLAPEGFDPCSSSSTASRRASATS